MVTLENPVTAPGLSHNRQLAHFKFDHDGRSADRCHPWRMRKLLLLLPALALESCSGGHDLMSNKSFSMTCDALEFFDMPSPWIVATISPELPQASVRVQFYEDK